MEKIINDCMECKLPAEKKEGFCAICLTQSLMKGKWKIAIIYLLKDKVLRFSELKRSIPKVTQAYLSKQLKEMENYNLIIRKSYNQVPPKVEYSLSENGRKFIKVIDVMEIWGGEILQEIVCSYRERLLRK